MTLVTASEARKIAYDLENQKEIEERNHIIGMINSYTRNRKYQVDIYQVDISDNLESELTNKGYKVEHISNMQDGNFTRISW